MNQILRILGIAVLVFITASSVKASGINPKINELSIQLPKQRHWILADNQSNSTQYLRTWLPKGMTLKNYDWMIEEQKVSFSGTKTEDAILVLTNIAQQDKELCTDVLFSGKPMKKVVKKYTGYISQTYCAQLKGENYGTVTSRLAIVDKNSLYLITSQLLTKPQKDQNNKAKAGVFELKTQSEAKELYDLVEQVFDSLYQDNIIIK